MKHLKTAILYTALSLVSLIAFAVGILFLPEEVAIHFNFEGVCDRMGSPWVYISLPAAAALISGGLFASALKEHKNTRIINIVLVALGAVLTTLGWVFFALGAQGTQLGEKWSFPFSAAILLSLSLLIMVLGNYMPVAKRNKWFGLRTKETLASDYVWEKANRFSGILLFAAGALSAAASILFSVLGLDLAALIVLLALLLIATVLSLIYAHNVAKLVPPEEQQNIQETNQGETHGNN